jgi:hypothetical protein
LNGELISRSKCKPAALPVHFQSCIQKAIYVTNPADTVSTETQQNQATNTQTIQKLPDKTDLIEQIGNIEILFLDDNYKEENQQTIVFLPETVPIVSFPNSSQLTIPAISDQTIEGSISTASSQQQPSENVHSLFPDELFWTQASLPLNDILQGELNTPEIDQLEGFNFDITTTENTSANTDKTDNKDQLNIINGIEEVHQLTELTIINNQTSNRQALDINSENRSITQFLQEHEQMLRSSQDPQVFEYSEDLNNINLGFGDNIDLNNSNFLSQNFSPGDFDMYNEFFGTNDLMETKEFETQSLSPLPAPAMISNPPSPIAPNVTEEQPQKPQEDSQKPSVVKLEGYFDFDFDLIKYMENDNALTPFEEKPCPSFNINEQSQQQQQEQLPVIKIEYSEPSTSTASSRKPSVVENDHSYDSLFRPKRTIKKRRYSTDSDFSVGTSASSYNSTKQKVHRRRRGRPAKELITDLPTIEELTKKGISAEKAPHLVLRIKNNEASRKSRMKSKNEQQKLEDQCTKLERRQSSLKERKDKLEAQIKQLHQWLLGAN